MGKKTEESEGAKQPARQSAWVPAHRGGQTGVSANEKL